MHPAWSELPSVHSTSAASPVLDGLQQLMNCLHGPLTNDQITPLGRTALAYLAVYSSIGHPCRLIKANGKLRGMTAATIRHTHPSVGYSCHFTVRVLTQEHMQL